MPRSQECERAAYEVTVKIQVSKNALSMCLHILNYFQDALLEHDIQVSPEFLAWVIEASSETKILNLKDVGGVIDRIMISSETVRLCEPLLKQYQAILIEKHCQQPDFMPLLSSAIAEISEQHQQHLATVCATVDQYNAEVFFRQYKVS